MAGICSGGRLMGALIVQDDVLELIAAKEEKFQKLVWWARKQPSDHPFWDTVPSHIKTGALNAASQVEEMYPDECDSLKCADCGDFEHGFNSGMLAALRFVLHATEDPETAEECFPELDT